MAASNSPGAKAANVGEFMTVIVNDCYEEKDQQIFHEGMTKLGEACKKMHGRGFMKISPKQRTDLLIIKKATGCGLKEMVNGEF